MLAGWRARLQDRAGDRARPRSLRSSPAAGDVRQPTGICSRVGADSRRRRSQPAMNVERGEAVVVEHVHQIGPVVAGDVARGPLLQVPEPALESHGQDGSVVRNGCGVDRRRSDDPATHTECRDLLRVLDPGNVGYREKQPRGSSKFELIHDRLPCYRSVAFRYPCSGVVEQRCHWSSGVVRRQPDPHCELSASDETTRDL